MTPTQFIARISEFEARLVYLESVMETRIGKPPEPKNPNRFKVVDAKRIQEAVCAKFGNRYMFISQNSRDCSHPRAVAMYLMRRLTSMSMPSIGNSFYGKDGGGMHHTTALHQVNKITHQRTYDNKLDVLLTELEGELK